MILFTIGFQDKHSISIELKQLTKDNDIIG